MPTSALILDDVEAAIGQLSDLGRSVVAPIARSVRTNIVMYAAAHGWPGISHSAFTQWATERMDDKRPWLILDPLCRGDALPHTAIRVRATRTATPNGWRLDYSLPAEVARAIEGQEVGVVEDVAVSGQTLQHIARLVEHARGRLTKIVTATSTEVAKSAVREVATSMTWEQFVAGDFSTAHVRDACPCLPFGGRPIHDRPFVTTEVGPVPVVAPVTAFWGGPWGQLALDSNLAFTVRSARRMLAARFSTALGRPATVSDIPLLGINVAVPANPKQALDEGTLLETLLT